VKEASFTGQTQEPFFRHRSGIALVLVTGLWLVTGCAGTGAKTPSSARHQAASDVAASMTGKPYRYGGSTAQGFDCSGLVHFSFKRAGLHVPRSTETQRQRSHRIARADLVRGDLVFFDQEGKNSSHVGIYLGNNRFVHAPSSGKRVRVDTLTDPYWRKHLVDTRRF
jgi:cell wall-associated NlpC family hydrolase